MKPPQGNILAANSLSLPPPSDSAAEGPNPPGELAVPTRPLLPGWSAARGLRPQLPLQEAVLGALRPTGDPPADRKRRGPQPPAWPPEPRAAHPTAPRTKGKGAFGGRRGAWLSSRDPQWPRGSKDSPQGGV